MSELLPNRRAGIQSRRTTRILQAVPLVVTGLNTDGMAFQERTSTITVNCHGCRYPSRHEVPIGSFVTMEIPSRDPEQPMLRVRGQVKNVYRPRTPREHFQIGLELETPGNIWGVAFPPADWVTVAGGESGTAPSAFESAPAPGSTTEKVRVLPHPATTPPENSSPPPERDRTSAQADAARLPVQGNLDAAAAKAVEAASNSYVSMAIRRAVQTIEDARGSALRDLKTQWAAEVEASLVRARGEVSAQAEAELARRKGAWDTELDQFRRQAVSTAERLDQTAASLRQTLSDAAQKWTGQNEAFEKTVAAARVAVEEARTIATRAAEDAARLAATSRQTAAAANQEPAAQGRVELPEDFNDTVRNAVTRQLEELDSKCTDLSHSTFEALSKAATWYEKKAHAGIEAATQRGMEQAASTLKEKAAEVSRLFASEMDHHSRSYSEHMRGLMEESAQEAARLGPQRLQQEATEAAARFQAEAGSATEAQLQRLNQQVQATVDAALLRLREHAQSMRAELEAATRQALDSSLATVRDACAEEANSLRAQWEQQTAQATDNAAEQYRQRLENLSNSWMVAAVTSVNQHTQQALDTLAHDAEARLRETWSRVFEGLASAMRVPPAFPSKTPNSTSSDSDPDKG